MKNFFNKQRTIATAALALVLVLNIIMLCLPAFGTYHGKLTETHGGVSVTAEFTVKYKGDKITINEKSGDGSGKEEGEVKYNAKKHQWESESGNAVTVRKSVFTQEVPGINLKLTSTLAIVMQIIFALGYVAGVFFLVVDKDKLCKKKVEQAE